MKTSGQRFKSVLPGNVCWVLKCKLLAFSLLTWFLHPMKCFSYFRAHFSAFLNAKPSHQFYTRTERIHVDDTWWEIFTNLYFWRPNNQMARSTCQAYVALFPNTYWFSLYSYLHFCFSHINLYLWQLKNKEIRVTSYTVMPFKNLKNWKYKPSPRAVLGGVFSSNARNESYKVFMF